MGRLVEYELKIDWGLSGSYAYDESDRLVTANGTMRLAAPASGISSPRGIVDACTITLDNRDGRYSALNSSSPLYGVIGGGKAYHAPVRLRVSVDGGSTYYTIFTGVIKVPVEVGPTPKEGAKIIIDCRSVDERLLTKRMSTTRSAFAAAHDNAYTEAEHMRAWLSAAGLTTANYDIDDGLFVIPWGWLDDESPLDEMWSLAAACGGRVYTDPDGVIRYENMQHWLRSPHGVSQETLTPSVYERIEPYFDDSELYSAVTVETSERALATLDVIWEADGVVTVRAGGTKTMTAKLRQPAYSITAVRFDAVSSGGINLNSDISVVTTEYAQRVELAITNSHAFLDANLVALSLEGVAVDGRPSQEETYESEADFWDNRQGRTRSLRMNPYVQTAAQADAVGRFLRDRYQEPRPFYRILGAVGDPSRRLGDRLTIDDPSISGAERDAFLTEIKWTADSNGFRQDLTAVDAAGLFAHDQYFVIGASLLNSTNEVAFY